MSKLVSEDIQASEERKLSKSAYGGINGEDYEPYIPTSSAMPEITVASIILGLLFTGLFAATNTYLALKVGGGISVNIPVAILSMTIFRKLLKRRGVLETNMVQSMASIGEGMSCGLIFTVPAIIVVGMKLDLLTIIIAGAVGGVAGILFIIPIRQYLMVKEHGKLLFPESMAVSEVIVSTEGKGDGFKDIMLGIGIGGAYKLCTEAFGFFKYHLEYSLKSLKNATVGVDVMGSLIGIGFICGLEYTMLMFGGAVLASLVFVPLVSYIGQTLPDVIAPGTVLIAEMDAAAIRDNYVKYIGAGAVATGGIISVIQAMPSIISSFKSAIKGISGKTSTKETDRDLNIMWVVVGAVVIFVACLFVPTLNLGFITSLLVVLCSFFFSIVSARIVGILGNTNSPVSGMTIAAVLAVTASLKITGLVGDAGVFAAIIASAIVCVTIAVSGDASQSLKVTHIMGGSPRKVQMGMLLSLITCTVVTGGVILLLANMYGVGSTQVPAPQALMIATLVQGIMTNELPWTFIFLGVALALAMYFLRMPVLSVAIGIYLPMEVSTSMLIGAFIRLFVEKKYAKDEKKKEACMEKGTLLASGLIAGDALFGILLALIAVFGLDFWIGPKILPSFIYDNQIATIVIAIIFCTWMYKYISKSKDKKLEAK